MFYNICGVFLVTLVIFTGAGHAMSRKMRLSLRSGLSSDTIQGGVVGNITCAFDQERCISGNQCVSILQRCNKILDCDDGSDEGSHCSYFDCGDGTFLSSEFVCDDYPDCSNNNDENRDYANCSFIQCANESSVSVVSATNICDGYSDCQDVFNTDECNCTFTFNCNNKKCIHINEQCNGDDNCGDNSDETNCQMFTCANGNRVVIREKCDGIDNCGDSSDECNCTDTFSCKNGRCTLMRLTCDEIDQCGDSSDECICDDVFQCDNKRCIPDRLVSNGFDDCWDGSDERLSATTSGPDPTPANREFKCKNGELISQMLLCNGLNDCKDGIRSDECQCNDTVVCAELGDLCINELDCIYAAKVFKQCIEDGGIPCDKKCVRRKQLCDGVDHCTDKEDERCFDCGDGARIPQSRVCNNITDCSDNSDECGCYNNTFKCANGKCITSEEKCTGNDACGDCSGETACPVDDDQPAGYGLFHCKNGHCFPARERCQGDAKCPDGEDLLGCDANTEEGGSPPKTTGRFTAQPNLNNFPEITAKMPITTSRSSSFGTASSAFVWKFIGTVGIVVLVLA